MRRLLTVLLAAATFAAMVFCAGGVPADLIEDTPSLVGYWKLDDAAGSTTAADASGGNTGAVFGGVTFDQPSAMPSLGRAAAFDGSGKIDIPYSAALNNDSYTFETWARWDGTAGYNSPLTSRDDYPQRGYILYASAADRWEFWNGTGAGWDAMTGLLDSVPDQWIHLTGTYDAATGVKSFYANGNFLVSGAPPGASPNTAQPLRIGAGATEGNGNYWFHGDVDNVAVFDAALDQQTVADQYNSFSRYAGRVLGDSPIGYWRLGEQSTYVPSGLPHLPAYNAADVTQHTGSYMNGVTIRQIGDTPLLDDIDTSVDFNAAGVKIDVPHSPELNPAGSFTVETWAKVEGSAGAYRSPVTARDQYTAPNYDQRGYILYATAADVWSFWTGAGSTWDAINGPPVAIDEWAHVVGTFDAQSVDANGVWTGTKRLYVNGRLVGEATQRYKPNERAPLRIGAGATEGNGNYWFDGKVDEVAFFGQALSPEQVLDHFVTATSPVPELLGYWRFEETGTQTVALDSSGNGLNGAYSAGADRDAIGPPGFNSATGFNDGGTAPGDNVALGAPAALEDLTNDFTIAAWIYPEALTGTRRIFSKDRTGGIGGYGFGVSGDELRFTTYGILDYQTSGVDLPLDEWSQVAVVFDSLNTAHFYVNGELVQSIAGPAPASTAGTGGFFIGTDLFGGEDFQGIIDEVAIWNGALTSDMIAAHYNGTLFVPEPGTLALLAIGLIGLAIWRRRS